MPEAAAVTGGLAVLVTWAAALQLFLPGALRRRRRLDRYVRAQRVRGEDARPRLSDRLVRVVRALGRPVRRVLGDRGLASAAELALDAGRPRGLDAVGVMELRYGGAFAGVLAGVPLALAMPPGAEPLAIVGGAALGYAAPGRIIASIAARRRREMARVLPTALDMLALAADAGLGLDSAIMHVVRRWNDPFAAELRRFLLELELGRDRRGALRELARRVRLPEVDRFTGALIQADALGVPLVRVLQEQAADVRARRRRHAEEQARTAPVKMLFPMVLLIFPALFIVILGPAVPRFLDAFRVGP